MKSVCNWLQLQVEVLYQKDNVIPGRLAGFFSSVIESGIGHAPGKLGDVMDEI